MSNNMFSVQSDKVLITGATGYLGRSLCLAFAEAGAHVFVNGRQFEAVKSVVDQITERGLVATDACFNVRNESEIEEFKLRYGSGVLSCIVNNAYAGPSGSIQDSESESYQEAYSVSVVAAHRLLRAFLPNLREAVNHGRPASIINVCSMYAGRSPNISFYESSKLANPPCYGAAKAGLLAWTRYAACEFGGENIRVNAISPGPFPSKAVQDENSKFVDRLSQRVPMGRVGNPAELVGPTLFLASSAASYVNGVNLIVDGGWSCW